MPAKPRMTLRPKNNREIIADSSRLALINDRIKKRLRHLLERKLKKNNILKIKFAQRFFVFKTFAHFDDTINVQLSI